MMDEQSLTQFGINLDDEFPHAFSENHDDWNESYFFDWYDAEGINAGHCRVGWHPVQKRVLFWLYLYNGDEWFVIEEFRLPFSELQLNKGSQSFSYEGWGLSFAYTPKSALQTGQLQVKGFARALCGKRLGMILPVSVDLDLTALGPAHSRGAGTVENHRAEGFNTNRYEQPMKAELGVSIGDEVKQLCVRGERDHSWGPRPWDMDWQFFVLNNEQYSLQATVVNIPEWPAIEMGYFQTLGEGMEHLSKVDLNLDYHASSPNQAVSGEITLLCDSGREIVAKVETISGMEIDITHAFALPKRSEYRRSLVRCHIEGESPRIGWLECNRSMD